MLLTIYIKEVFNFCGALRNCFDGIETCISPYSRVNSFGAKFQTTFVVCVCVYLTKYRLERSLYVKFKDWMPKSVDPDERVSSGSVLLQKLIIIAYGSKRVIT